MLPKKVDPNKPKATKNDFHLDFNALLGQAHGMGVDTTVEANRVFIEHTAGVLAECNATIRFLYSQLHPRADK